MKTTKHRMALSLIYLALFGVVGSPAFATGNAGVTAAAAAQTKPAAVAQTKPAAVSSENQVRHSASQEINKRRQSLDNEAIAANDEILHAMLDIEKKDTKGAFEMLEKADGRLSVIMARDPHLTMPAIDVRASISDIETSPDVIRNAVKDAKVALDEGQIQTARSLLSPLVSEMRIATDYLPLDVYPDAIKRASKALQEGKLKEAETELADTMSSIVTIVDVIPLPPIKAQGDVLAAEQLIREDKVKNKAKALSLLTSADDHLANASVLGYGKYQDIRDEISAIKSDVKTGKVKLSSFQLAENILSELIHGREKS